MLLIFSTSVFAETYKLESSIGSVDAESGLRTCCGNAFAVTKDTIVTCWHTVEGKTHHKIKVQGKWIQATIIKRNIAEDLCLLKIDKAILEPVEFKSSKIVTIGADMTNEIKNHAVEMKYGILKSNYNLGISGSPVLEDGKLIGMIITIDNDKGPTESKFVSSAIIKEFLNE